MANPVAGPNVYYIAVTSTPVQVSTAVFPITKGCKIYASAAVSYGLNANITHEAAAATDGFPVAATTQTQIDPGFCADLSLLYLVTTSTANVWIVYPKNG